jgi:hypothetical protein
VYFPLAVQVDFDESKVIDLNGDGTVDISVYSESYVDQIDRLDAFLIRPLEGNRIKQVKLTDNPQFNSLNVMSYSNAELIGEALAPEHTWGTSNGILAMRHTSNSVSYIGRWSDGNEKMLAMKLNLKGEVHFAWLKLQFSRKHHSITVTGFAYAKKAGESIKSGQVE